MLSALRTPEGALVPDRRQPFYAAPIWVDDPFLAAGEGRGPGWNDMDNVVPFNLHTLSPEQRDADSGKLRRLFGGRAGPRVVLHRVAGHVEPARGPRLIGKEPHPYAVVVHFVASDASMEGVTNQNTD